MKLIYYSFNHLVFYFTEHHYITDGNGTNLRSFFNPRTNKTILVQYKASEYSDKELLEIFSDGADYPANEELRYFKMYMKLVRLPPTYKLLDLTNLLIHSKKINV